MQPDNPYPRLGQAGTNDEMNLLVGKTLGKFRIVSRIGAGGMATVFKAYQANLDRYVAIKVLPSHYAHDKTFAERFEREARAIAKLQHANIVPIHDFAQEEINLGEQGPTTFTYIVMEYVEGGTLKDRLKQPLSIPEAVDFMVQAAEGLDCAHRKNIVHRDVKPANMLVREGNQLLISDFGIVKMLEATTNLTRVGTGLGTPQYMSPEQGTGQAVDRRSDIYSLGIVLFHCLVGHVPYTGDSPLSITVKHLQEPFPVDKLRMSGVPTPIEQVVSKMTAKPPQDRYQTATDVELALTNALAASGLSMPRHFWPVSLPEQPGSSGPLPGVFGMQGIPSQSLNPQILQMQPSVTIACFRCGAANPTTRPFCTSCGYELSDKRAIADRYTGPNGRPVLARLTIQNGPMAGRSYLFHQDVTTIGRTNGNDLIISGRTVSRQHARLWFDNGRWYIQDKQSANGTSVNNMRISQPTPLNDGDVIHFGDEAVIFNITYR